MTCQWNYTILQNSHRESGLSILKKGNHSVNGKTHNGHDLSVAKILKINKMIQKRVLILTGAL